MAAPQALSINVGLNQVTSNVFQADPLFRCEDDATAMRDLAKAAGFDVDFVFPTTGKPGLLLGQDATLANVTATIEDAAEALKLEGGILLFTFAGHGTFRVLEPDQSEPDGQDETIVLTDHMLLDNAWKNDLWPQFGANVRAVAIADCCNSGGVFTSLRMFAGRLLHSLQRSMNAAAGMLGLHAALFNFAPDRIRSISQAQRRIELESFPEIYAEQTAVPSPPKSIVVPRIMLAACGENENAKEGPTHGRFTEALLSVWQAGAASPVPGASLVFHNTYAKFMDEIKSKFSQSSQHPQLISEGQPDFTNQHPFSIK